MYTFDTIEMLPIKQKYMKYQLHEKHKKSNNPYNWENGCDHCKLPFGEDEEFKRVDVQTSFMRGDDEVYVFHNKCFDEGMKVLKEQYK